MSLRGNCTICTDYFGSDQEISATFCGHVFHGPCLSQWLLQCGNQRTCPQCRTKLSAKQIVPKLYITSHENEEDELDPYRLKNELNETNSKFQDMKLKKKKLKDLLKECENNKEKLKKSINVLKKDLQNERHTSELLKSELKNAKMVEKEAINAQKNMKRMRERLQTCEKLELMINGQRSEVDKMMQQYTSESEVPRAVQQLATFCVSLKQEYEALKESRNKMKLEMMKNKKELHKAHQDLGRKTADLEETVRNHLHLEEQLSEENKGLRKKLEALQNAVSSPSDTRSSLISRLIAESPAPLLTTPKMNPSGRTKMKRLSTGEVVDMIPLKSPKLSKLVFDFDADEGEGTSTGQKTPTAAQSENVNCVSSKSESVSSASRKNDGDTPNTVFKKKVCKEMGLKYVKTEKADSMAENIEFRRPFGIHNATAVTSFRNPSHRLNGSYHSRFSTASRRNKVPMSSKAKPFTSKPVLTSSLRPKNSIFKM